MNGLSLDLILSHPRNRETGGLGYFGGSAPEGTADVLPDGRAKIMNAPAYVFVSAHLRASMLCVASTMSDADGTWRIGSLNPNVEYLVIGTDKRRLVNSAVQDWVKPHVPEP